MSAADICQKHIDRAEANHRGAAMPESARIKTEFVAIFGPGIKMPHAQEGGLTLGRDRLQDDYQVSARDMVLDQPRAPQFDNAYRD